MGELDRIESEAAALDSQAVPAGIPAGDAPGTPGAPAVPDPKTEARGLVSFALALFVPLWPSLAAVYTADKQAALADAAVPLMAKYDITLATIFERWPEINFAVVAVPLAIETGKAVKADNAAKAAAKVADKSKASGEQSAAQAPAS